MDAAKGRASKAGNAPELHKSGGHQTAAKKALTHANASVVEAQAELDQVIGKARKLAEEHEQKAHYRADKIRNATRKLAPWEPGAFDRVLDWLGDNLPDILSACAAVLGALALLGLTVVAPWVLFLVAGLLSGIAFGLRVSDPKVLASLKDGILDGRTDLDFWSNLLGVAGDFLGCCPGRAP